MRLTVALALAHRIALYRDGRILRTMSGRESTMTEVLGELTGAR